MTATVRPTQTNTTLSPTATAKPDTPTTRRSEGDVKEALQLLQVTQAQLHDIRVNVKTISNITGFSVDNLYETLGLAHTHKPVYRTQLI